MAVSKLVSAKSALNQQYFALANCIWALSFDAVEAAKSGHPGASMGLADAATVLFSKHLNFRSSASDWPNCDRFVLSIGHASMLLYSLLHLTGYADMTIKQLRNFRQWGSITAGHPNMVMLKALKHLHALSAKASPQPWAWRSRSGDWPLNLDQNLLRTTLLFSSVTAAFRKVSVKRPFHSLAIWALANSLCFTTTTASPLMDPHLSVLLMTCLPAWKPAVGIWCRATGMMPTR